MKKRVDQLLNGKYKYEVSPLILSEEKIDRTTAVGEHVQGVLHLGSKSGERIKGFVTVTNPRIVAASDKFTGTSISLSYGVDVTGMVAGEACRGSIILSTNIGEYKIPVRVEITAEPVVTSRGEMDTLDDFTTLFRENPREAFRFFTGEDFLRYLKSASPEQMTLYKGMSENPVTYQHVEEFLVGAGKKAAVSISVQAEETEFYNLRQSVKSFASIRKSGWGYLNIEIEVVGDFIEVQKKRITADEFVGSVYHLEYIIHQDRLNKGRRFGCILLKTVYGVKKIEIAASKNPPVKVDLKSIDKRNKITLMQQYLDYRLGRISASQWALKTQTVLECIRQMGDYPIEYRLYEAYVSLLTGDYAEARIIMRGLEKHSFAKESLEAKGMFLYLCHELELLKQNQIDVVRRIRAYQQRKQESLMILLILFRVDEDVKRTPAKKIYYMENLYDMGCRSPLLYMEAYRMVKTDLAYLKRTNPFWQSVLLYVAKEGLFTEEIALRAAYLSVNERTFTDRMYRILESAYEAYPNRDILDAICKLIMKGNPGDKQFFKWYELAVEEEIKITRLYEYYIETMPEHYQKMLPQVIRMYFAYNNTLSDSKRAFVYANVIRNKKVDKNTYKSYQEAMERFAKEQLLRHRINEDYAVIYQEFLKELPDKKTAEAMAEVLFTHRIYCEDKKVRSVIVCHGELEKEEVYPCMDGVSYISVYTSDAQILFQDEMHRRYVATVEYNMQRLMDIPAYVEQCIGFDVHHSGLLLYACKDQNKDGVITLQNMQQFRYMVDNDSFSPEYQMQIRKKLLHFYSLHAGEESLDRYLSGLDYDKFAQVDKVSLIEVLISRGMYRAAFALLCKYGHEHVSVYKLVRLCSRMIELDERLEAGLEEEELTLLCAHVYRLGKYDERILKYLLKYFDGSLEDMCRIRQSGVDFYLDTYEMEERILLVSMFVRRYVENGADILDSYGRRGGRNAVVLGYLTFLAYGYYWDELAMEETTAGVLASVYEREIEADEVCALALLKYYSNKKHLTAKEENQVEELLERYQQMGLRFGFFQNLSKIFLQPYQLDDSIFVEQKAAPNSKVVIHYAIVSGKDEALVYKSEPMKMMYQGIFSKEFVLFYGETLHYYITIESGDTVTQTQKAELSMPGVDRKGRSRYQMINQMMAARSLGKDTVLYETIRKFKQAEIVSQELFQLIK